MEWDHQVTDQGNLCQTDGDGETICSEDAILNILIVDVGELEDSLDEARHEKADEERVVEDDR